MVLRRVLLIVIALFALLQLVPYGRAHTNPAVANGPAWDSPRTEQLARRACFDCHSHETKWPWYAWVAPVSWRIQHDVEEGRAKVNFSAFRADEESAESAEEVRERKMPPASYVLAHPEAKLDAAERDALIRGLARTFGDPPEGGRGHAEEAEEEEDRGR